MRIRSVILSPFLTVQVVWLDAVAARARYGRWVGGVLPEFVPFPKTGKARGGSKKAQQAQQAAGGGPGGVESEEEGGGCYVYLRRLRCVLCSALLCPAPRSSGAALSQWSVSTSTSSQCEMRAIHRLSCPNRQPPGVHACPQPAHVPFPSPSPALPAFTSSPPALPHNRHPLLLGQHLLAKDQEEKERRRRGSGVVFRRLPGRRDSGEWLAKCGRPGC